MIGRFILLASLIVVVGSVAVMTRVAPSHPPPRLVQGLVALEDSSVVLRMHPEDAGPAEHGARAVATMVRLLTLAVSLDEPARKRVREASATLAAMTTAPATRRTLETWTGVRPDDVLPAVQRLLAANGVTRSGPREPWVSLNAALRELGPDLARDLLSRMRRVVPGAAQVRTVIEQARAALRAE